MTKLYILIAFLISQTIAIIFLNNNNEAKINQLLAESNKLIQTQYSTVYDSFTTLAHTVFRGYIDKPDIIEDFRSRDRESLYINLKPSYRYLKSLNFKQIHFHLPNNLSFLRMHKPSKFGDDLTKFRYSVDYVNTNKKFISGLEMGKIVPGFRYVYPMFDSNGHIGSVETSFSVYAFAKQLEKSYDIYTHFILQKDILSKKLFKDESVKYLQSLENQDFVTLARKDKLKRESEVKYLKPLFNTTLKDKVNKGIKTNKIFSIELKVENKNKYIHKIITFLPLENIQKQKLGYFVVYHDDKVLLSLEKELYQNYIAITIILLLLFLFLYKQITIKERLAFKVGEQTAKLQEAAVEAEEHAAEIEILNVSLEERIKFEVQKNAEHERKLANQSKQSALGDMIGNIAHQWRQPLSAITTATTGMQLNNEMGLLEKDDFNKFANGIIKNTDYLSQTINDFRDFISHEKKFETFNIQNMIEKCLTIINASVIEYNLKVITTYEDNLEISNYANELQQAIIYLFNTAKDA